MSPGDELFDAVARRLTDTSYTARRTPDGFVVRRELSGEDWHAHRPGSRVDRVVQNHVSLDERTWVLTITDEHVEVTWRDTGRGRVPVIGSGAQVSRRRGRISERTSVTTWSRDGVGRRTYDTAEVHRYIRAAAEELGWAEQRGAEEKAGRRAALFGAVFGGLTLATLVVAAALGGFR